MRTFKVGEEFLPGIYQVKCISDGYHLTVSSNEEFDDTVVYENDDYLILKDGNFVVEENASVIKVKDYFFDVETHTEPIKNPLIYKHDMLFDETYLCFIDSANPFIIYYDEDYEIITEVKLDLEIDAQKYFNFEAVYIENSIDGVKDFAYMKLHGINFIYHEPLNSMTTFSGSYLTGGYTIPVGKFKCNLGADINNVNLTKNSEVLCNLADTLLEEDLIVDIDFEDVISMHGVYLTVEN